MVSENLEHLLRPGMAMTKFTYRGPLSSAHSAMAIKVIEDIHFLRDRIARAKQLQTPNSTVLETYKSMLASRESVLAWLKEQGHIIEEAPEDTQGTG